ncbi:golgi SNAP receptor complex member 1 [[Candida] railenensis]|uniref:Golgi SNAP receptor complex member 1 n=1 Tax=[Candida] railenensis TaxID=45579 RepID=A0A9P0QRX8_9ASCO|nr:golgi SNAP receptor complex member 1 [[Candida] railenensis]
MSSPSFAQTRGQALNLEKQTDAQLSKYSSFQNTSSTSATEEETSIEQSINELLDKRDQIISALNRISESDLSLSTSKLQQLQRHKEIFQEHKSIYDKIKATIKDDRNRNNLLFSVRSDIDAHKQRNVSSGNGGSSQDANNYINEERVRVDSANSFAERLLQQAYTTRDELFSQRNYLNNAQSTMMNTIQTIPGINVLISRINTRRRRDTLILASVISVCIIVIFLY